MSRFFKPIVASALLVLVAVMFTGCAHTNEVDNVSERPWNDTVGWQGGLPSGINQGR